MDVVIHCGDLTEESKLDEFRTSVELLKSIDAPLKLVIAGNHDFTLDIPTFRRKLAAIDPPLDSELVRKTYGEFGEARALFETAKDAGVEFLDEGMHRFFLANGAELTVYASPYTQSLSGDGGFQYLSSEDEQRSWAIEEGTDVVITHSPPCGVLDRTSEGRRAGSSSLFTEVARCRPKVHCFGHIHEGWGAKLVAWNDLPAEQEVTHFNAVDGERSSIVETLAGLTAGKFDDEATAEEKRERKEEVERRGFYEAALRREDEGKTLFVNAAVEGMEEGEQQVPWVVEVDLPVRARVDE